MDNEKQREFDEDEFEELIERVDHSKLIKQAIRDFLENPPNEIDHHLISTYNEYDNPNYNRGMFIDTNCDEAHVHDYREMRALLEELQNEYPSDVEMFSAGKSEGYGSSRNALDVWGINIYAKDRTERTAFFVGGQHLGEWSGSETVYLVAKRLLQSYCAGNPNVKNVRRNTHCIAGLEVRQIDPLIM